MDSSEPTLTTLVGVMADMLRREQRGDRLAVEIGLSVFTGNHEFVMGIIGGIEMPNQYGAKF